MQEGKGPRCGRPGTGWAPQARMGPRHSPVQLGVFHQRVGVPVPDEGPAREADEALGVVFQLPGHLAGGWWGQPSSAAPAAP